MTVRSECRLFGALLQLVEGCVIQFKEIDAVHKLDDFPCLRSEIICCEVAIRHRGAVLHATMAWQPYWATGALHEGVEGLVQLFHSEYIVTPLVSIRAPDEFGLWKEMAVPFVTHVIVS